MKIAVLAPQLIPTHPAGGQMLKVIRALSLEHDFTVFGRKVDESLAGKVRFHQLPIPIVRPRLLTYLVQFWLYQYIFNRLEIDKNFDIVHSLEASSPVATVVTMQFCGAKALELVGRKVIDAKGARSIYQTLVYQIGSRMERLAVTNPFLKQLICVSKGLAQEIVHYHKPPIAPVIIPNSVDVDRFSKARQYREQTRRQLGLADEQVVGVICSLGDWERKGLGVLVEAVSLLPRGTVKIVVVGGGPLEIYKRRCEQVGLIEDFIFVGFTREVERFYGAADFFIFPTAYEAWPIVALEAAASGLPLLATSVNGLEDFIQDGVNGFFVTREPENVANAIARVIDDPRRLVKMGREAQRRVQAFRVERMVDAYRQLYEEMEAIR